MTYTTNEMMTVAALEQRSALSDEELEAQALAEAIEQERREQQD